MLQLKLTQKAQKKLGLKPKDLEEIEKSDSSLGDWFVNLFYLERRKTLLFVNEKTLFSFILYGIRRENTKDIHRVFLKGLEQALVFEEIEMNKVDELIDQYSSIRFTKTDNKKVLGNMNDLVNLYRHIFYSRGGFRACNLSEIIMQINRTPQRNVGWSYSIDIVKEILNVG